jgi:ATP-dependent DNA ligase
VFDLIRRARHGDQAVLCVFDLIELDGLDLRHLPIEQRKAKLARLVTAGAFGFLTLIQCGERPEL